MKNIDRKNRLSFQNIKTNSVFERKNLVTILNMARPYEDELKQWDKPKEFDELVDKILQFRTEGKPVIWSMGAHVIKNGLSRYIIEMVREGFLTHVSGNGATSIHDFELAFLGETSEDVATAIEDGSFGMWEETGRYMNEAIQLGAEKGLGYGESLYKYLSDNPSRFPHYDDCVFVQCQIHGVPYTCHISIGTDIIHQHPIVDFERLGQTSGKDFDILCNSFLNLSEGGVFLNFGSAISGPELFLKAVSQAKNKGLQMKNITAANYDIIPVQASYEYKRHHPYYHYRPRRNFIDLLQKTEGTGYLFQGLHQITIPHLFHALLKRKKELGLTFHNPGKPKNIKKDPTLYSINQRRSDFRIANILPIDYRTSWGEESEQFRDFINHLVSARKSNKEALVSLGGNIIDSGVSNHIIQLLEQGLITHIATTGSTAYQDFELAAFGETAENVDDSFQKGTLGMWAEPGSLFHKALREGYKKGLGYGESLMDYIECHETQFPFRHNSILFTCNKLKVPITCHITLGTDDIQLHPESNFRIQGGASGRDFQRYCTTVSKLEGGVFVNFGSTVTGPEVFLKALSIGRNLRFTIQKITTANFDIVKLGNYQKKVGYEDWDYYYRPRKNIIHRPTSLGGIGFHFEGLHQETIPAIWRELSKLKMVHGKG
ncbi:hypothetical protein [Bacillus sp. T33-2]|uniref:hypothetical protein n=1 Tax=Bacillus sp. T33-2 TaxID=2054168 RepID=UPI0015E159BA|nr:hypothetical protein [Bacillus sp. T33-2]